MAKRNNDSTRAPIEQKPRKKYKSMGRPKNKWTPSKLRKLVRLYLFTDLNVEDIASLLSDRTFKPCKRDVQKQLNALLQNQPRKVRVVREMNEVRIRMVRGCRVVLPLDAPTKTSETSTTTNDVGNVLAAHSHDSLNPSLNLAPDVDWSWVDLESCSDLSTTRDFADRGSIRDQFPCQMGEVTQNIITDDLDVLAVPHPHPPPLLDASKYHQQKLPTVPNLVHFPEKSPHRTATFISDQRNIPTTNMLQLSHEASLMPLSTENVTEMVATKSDTAVNKLCARIGTPRKGLARASFSYAGSIKPAASTSLLACLQGLKAMQNGIRARRESYLADILSVMQNWTLSSQSIKENGNIATDSGESCQYPDLNEKEREWHLGHVDKIRFSSILLSRKRNKFIEPKRVSLPDSFVSWSIMNYSGEVDQSYNGGGDVYGNSLLHTAAAVGKSFEDILEMIENGADVHARNSGGQSFLHIIITYWCTKSPDVKGLVQLFQKLYEEDFEFHQRDDNGQSPVLLLIKGCGRGAFDHLECISILSLIKIRPLRDNSCYTTLNRWLRDTFPAECFFSPRNSDLEKPHSLTPAVNSRSCSTSSLITNTDQYIPNYGPSTAIETIEDLVLYERNADLLRTIIKAHVDPYIEQAVGKNGLHCLAEVVLDLPLRDVQTRTIDTCPSNSREAYLEGLLLARVDVNNHDELGYTPLMRFIMCTHRNEDEEARTRILARICDAGANINARDKMGWTPLHLAVVLGEVTATKLLLSRKANIHARDVYSRGIIECGARASETAEDDTVLYSKIMLCISLVVDAGGVSHPNPIKEWAKR